MRKKCIVISMLLLCIFLFTGCDSSKSIYNCHLIQKAELIKVFDKSSGKTTYYYMSVRTEDNKELSAKIEYDYYNELTQYKKSKDFEGSKILLDCIYDSGTEAFTGVSIHKDKDKDK